MGATGRIDDCSILVVFGDDAQRDLGNRGVGLWLEALSKEFSIPLYFVKVAAGQDFKTSFAGLFLRNEDRPVNRLLVAGTHLEDAVTFTSLHCLLQGFDVFVLVDLIAVANAKYANFHWERLFQAGGVPTTMTQILAEWELSETSPTLVTQIKSHASNYRQLCR
jgi:Isochorismatase family